MHLRYFNPHWVTLVINHLITENGFLVKQDAIMMMTINSGAERI